MAELLWGKVYFYDQFAGVLREEPGGRIIFQYDPSFLESSRPQISHTLPKQQAPFISERGLHSFFDNLVSEGYMEEIQGRLLGKRSWSRFELLLAFGQDCAGAVSVIDPIKPHLIEPMDAFEDAVVKGSASLSGVQAKLALVKEHGKFRPSRIGETSTHFAKFSSPTISEIIENEYLTTEAIKTLLPKEEIVELQLSYVEGFKEQVLIVKRFDRGIDGEKIHFEEFTQLLNLSTLDKYEGAYSDMAHFISTTKGCLLTEVFRLYRRLVAGFLLGNTDMHLKNFAMYQTPSGYRLTPFYDLVSAATYHPRFQAIALNIAGAQYLPIGSLKAKHLLLLAKQFGLTEKQVKLIVKDLFTHLDPAKATILSQQYGSKSLKESLISQMEKRWNGTFSSIGT